MNEVSPTRRMDLRGPGSRSRSGPLSVSEEIARCDREIAECMAYAGPDQFGALWGEMDWRVEREILRAEMPKPYYEHDGIVIYHGDCREILPQLGPVDLVLTDPPYEITATGGGMGAKRKYLADISGHIDGGFDFSILARFRNWMAFCSKEQMPRLIQFAIDAGLRWMLVTWNKSNPTPLVNGNYLPDTEYLIHGFFSSECLHGGYESRSRFILHPGEQNQFAHPTVKPVAVMSRLVSTGSGDGGIILDPFMGSGTTLVAAKRLGRRCVGVEIEEKYCAIAAARLERERLTLFEHAGIADAGLFDQEEPESRPHFPAREVRDAEGLTK